MKPSILSILVATPDYKTAWKLHTKVLKNVQVYISPAVVGVQNYLYRNFSSDPMLQSKWSLKIMRDLSSEGVLK